MKAVALGAPGGLDHIQLIDLPDPGSPAAGEIRVRLHASSLNYHDYLVALRTDERHFGRIPMADGAGVVEQVGRGVEGFAEGDHVVSTFFPHWLDGEARIGNFSTVPGDGVDGYAREAIVRPATWFTRAPRHLDHAESATLTTAGLTAWRALVGDDRLKAGDTVLALGTGGVSIFALQLAKAMGASVIITSSSDEKLARARALGADHVINYRNDPQWGDTVRKLTGGGVDHVIEVGGPGTLAQSIKAVRVAGHISLIGVLTGGSGEIPTAALMAKQARLQGLIVGSRRQQQEMVRALEAIELHPVIDRRFPLERIADAFRHEAAHAHFGKICLEF
ncbi:NAD(P)-dependent alcohol dehydrogenase [Pigmentiphaga sp. H8]|uniref:zinc-dependent alcohol dehydrogenase family protein n=1 Tax=Pigmentiphaga sp. H8 TaxID=2488560 RepID=UPI000F5A7319|nr:NAD(P)-dependent alcohol dehydrogenase [Pigmentiphaga sp. H8]AZG07627.1 NAD(P)-dependent alcohol dehydrogenase [Pigmentiphaga sp. H8]